MFRFLPRNVLAAMTTVAAFGGGGALVAQASANPRTVARITEVDSAPVTARPAER